MAIRCTNPGDDCDGVDDNCFMGTDDEIVNACGTCGPVPDEIWNEAARHYDDQSLAALVVQIANINRGNRLNIATRQIAGAHEW